MAYKATGGVNYSAEACSYCLKVWNLAVLLLKRE